MLKFIPVLFLGLGFSSVNAQTAEEIVAKHIEAIGGKDNWSKIESMRSQAKMSTMGIEIPIITSQIHNKAMRVDISVMGKDGYMILTNSNGWNFMPFMGQTAPEPLTEEDVKKGQDQLNIRGEFFTWKEDGKKLEYLGTEDMDGTECLKLKLTDKENIETTYYLDPETYYILKETTKFTANGKEVTGNTTYGNFKKLDCGIVVPMTTNTDQGPMEFINIEINPKLEETLFKV